MVPSFRLLLLIALSSILLTKLALGLVPMVQDKTYPSKQSINGDKYILPLGILIQLNRLVTYDLVFYNENLF